MPLHNAVAEDALHGCAGRIWKPREKNARRDARAVLILVDCPCHRALAVKLILVALTGASTIG
jgi:hypothetical protein